MKYASFEEVAMLLRDGELPSSDALADFQKVLHERYEVKRDIRLMMWALPANGHPMDVLQTTIASMATFYPDAGAQDPNSAYTQSALEKVSSAWRWLSKFKRVDRLLGKSGSLYSRRNNLLHLKHKVT